MPIKVKIRLKKISETEDTKPLFLTKFGNTGERKKWEEEMKDEGQYVSPSSEI